MNKKWLAGPYLVWMVGFIVIPLLLIVYYGLTDKSGAFTLANVLSISTPEHVKALWLSGCTNYHSDCYRLSQKNYTERTDRTIW